MSGVRIEGDIRKLYKRLSKLENNDMRRVNAVLAEAIRASTLDRFRNEEAPNGTKWKPTKRTSTSTRREKILTNTGRLTAGALL